LEKEVHMIFISANVQKENGIPFGNLSTDLFHLNVAPTEPWSPCQPHKDR